jgi:hypothetical protein
VTALVLAVLVVASVAAGFGLGVAVGRVLGSR